MSEKARSETSGVLTRLPQKQIQEMKEAFTMIDVNRDGFIDEGDLKAMYESLGAAPPDSQIKEMMKEITGQFNFTMFLTLFSDKLSGSDSEETIRNAFKMFDENDTGKLQEEYIKDLLENMGDNFTKDEMRQTFKEAPVEGGKFDYLAFTKILKGSDQAE